MKRRNFLSTGTLGTLGLGAASQSCTNPSKQHKQIKKELVRTDILVVGGGHAAGLAASLSVKKGLMPREVKVAEIQDALRKDGVDLTMAGTIQEGVSSDRKA